MRQAIHVSPGVRDPNPRRFDAINRIGPLELRIAESRAEFESAFSLVYKSYLVQGYVEPSAQEILYRLSYGLPTSRTILAISPNGQTVGTLTLVGDGCLGLPMEAIFHQEVEELRRQGRSVAEVSALAIDPSLRSASLATFFKLTQFMVQYACWRRFNDLVISVHPRHTAFYQHQFQFVCIGPCRSYQKLKGHPAVASRLDLDKLQQMQDPAVFARYFDRLIDPIRFESDGISPADHEYFCRKAGLLPERLFGNNSWEAPAA